MENFHTIEQGTRNRVQGVGGRYKENARQVEGEIEIVIAKRPVLLWIENLE